MGIEQLNQIENFMFAHKGVSFKVTELRDKLGMNYYTLLSSLNYLVAKKVLVKKKKSYIYGGKI
jgi:hypothetical protein